MFSHMFLSSRSVCPLCVGTAVHTAARKYSKPEKAVQLYDTYGFTFYALPVRLYCVHDSYSCND